MIAYLKFYKNWGSMLSLKTAVLLYNYTDQPGQLGLSLVQITSLILDAVTLYSLYRANYCQSVAILAPLSTAVLHVCNRVWRYFCT